MKSVALLLAAVIATSLGGATRDAHAAGPTPEAVSAWLIGRDHAGLAQALTAVQEGFEAGRLSELDLRQAFAPFGALRDPAALASLRDWAAQSPNLYVARLALGLSDRALGSEARGRQYWGDTAPERREGMQQHFALAEPELRQSVVLTSKPYLSLLNLMSIAANLGDRGVLNAALLMANDALPGNRTARLQYARFLLPRWGGSHERLDAFVAQSRAQGVAESTLMQMQAIGLNDRAQALRAERDEAGAGALFRQALQLARDAGDVRGFRNTYLSAAVRQVCRDAGADRRDPLCRTAQGDTPAITASPSGVAGRLGEDLARAVVLPPVPAFEGIRTEHAWIALRHPGARQNSQALVQQDGRRYDVLSITLPDGRDLELHFDVTAIGERVGRTPASGSPSHD